MPSTLSGMGYSGEQHSSTDSLQCMEMGTVCVHTRTHMHKHTLTITWVYTFIRKNLWRAPSNGSWPGLVGTEQAKVPERASLKRWCLSWYVKSEWEEWELKEKGEGKTSWKTEHFIQDPGVFPQLPSNEFRTQRCIRAWVKCCTHVSSFNSHNTTRSEVLF